jgi:hypothetical protein
MAIGIVVKIDGDGQMDGADQAFCPPDRRGCCGCHEGEPLHDLNDIRSMPLVRLFGNAALSFLTKLSSGYWSVRSNKRFCRVGLRILAAVPMEKVASGYFFESDILFRIGFCAPRFSTFRWRPPTGVR